MSDDFFEEALKAVEKQDSDQGKFALIIAEIRRQRQAFETRPAQCDSRYVKMRHVMISMVALTAFLMGYTTVQFNSIKSALPVLVKAAIAAALK
jgi:hypothetical protein